MMNPLNSKRWLGRDATGLALLFLTLAGLVQAASAVEQSAFTLAKEGNRYISEDAKDKIVQIRSEKSVASLAPDIWYIVYYDPDATLKAVEVKFVAGKKTEVKRPARILEPITRSNEPLPKERLKTDSDKALAIASNEPLLEKLQIKASKLTLERRSFDDATPVWKVRLWASKPDNPGRQADVGEVFITCEDGKVVKSDLKVDALE